MPKNRKKKREVKEKLMVNLNLNHQEDKKSVDMGEKRYKMNKVARNYLCALFSVPASQLTTAL